MPGYLTRELLVPISGTADLRIRLLRDNQQFSDPAGLADAAGISSAQWPLFGQLWPSGAQLAARVARHPVTRGERILEVGCGLALASLVAHRRGADVTASDCHPLAAEFLAHNTALNGLPALPYRTGHWTPPGAAAGDALQGRFDLIVGSDVLYERHAAQALAGFIGRHAAAQAAVWIVDPNRGHRPAFTRVMRSLGFALQDELLRVAAAPQQAAYRGHLLSYRRGAAEDVA